jgi:EmrB/QacA subfamily drug resistance transporter
MSHTPLAATPARTFRESLWAMAGICLVIMLVALDSTVVGTAMPRIVAELQGYDLYPWIASSYLMTNAVLIPIIGRLGDLYGRKPFVLASVVLFTLASVLCGASQTMMQLVLARGLQGVGGGMLTGVAFACVTDLFPDRVQRVRWQAMMSATFGVASAVGPALGGWLTEHAGWRSVFFINLPVALCAFPMAWRFLPRIVHHTGTDRSIDWLGAALLAAAIVTLLLGTEKGQSAGFTNPWFIVLIIAAVLLGVWFVRHQRSSRAPVVPMRMFARAGVKRLAALGVLTGLVMFGLIFYSPLMLQGGFGMSPNTAGITLTPLLVCVTLGSITNGRLMTRMKKPERLLTYGLALLFVGCVALSFVGPDTPRWITMLTFGICGLSLGFQLPNLTLQIQACVERHDLGAASALIQNTRMLGSMIGTSVGAAIVNLTFAREAAHAMARAAVSDARIVSLLQSPQVLIREEDHAALLQAAQSAGVNAAPLLEQVRAGLVSGVHHTYIACAVLVIVSFIISLRLPHYAIGKPQAQPSGAAR